MDGNDLVKLKQLAIFATVIDQGSFSAAARALSMSRSAVSEQVALLEDSLGVRLLQRTTRQLTLTLEGEAVYPQSSQLMHTLGDIVEATRQGQYKGRVRITTTQDFAVKWLQPRLQRFRETYPEIYFDLILSDKPLDLIAEQIDLAVRVGFLEDDSLVARPLFEDAPVVVASRSYLEKYGAPADVNALQSCDWVLLSQMNNGQRVTLHHHEHPSLCFRPARYHQCDSPMTMYHMLMAGMGIGMHLPSMLTEAFADGRLQRLLPDWQGEVYTFSLVYPSRRQLPLRTRCVLEFLLQNARQF